MTDATLALARLLVLMLAGAGLWWLWRSARTSDPLVRAIVDAGFLLRAVGGMTLFWISWLELPLFRSLQAGGGAWFFAPDGPHYLDWADEGWQGGIEGILDLGARYKSHVFVQIVAVCVALFGKVLSLALFLNSVVYLVTCRVIIGLAGPERTRSAPCLFALGAWAFGPSALLWSTQLLKDPTLIAAAAVAVGGLEGFRRWSRDGTGRIWRWQDTAAVGAVLSGLYVVAGIRWYLAIMIWSASLVFLAMVVIAARRRLVVFVASVALVAGSAAAVRGAASTDLPSEFERVITWAGSVPMTVVQMVAVQFPSRVAVERAPVVGRSAPAPKSSPAKPSVARAPADLRSDARRELKTPRPVAARAPAGLRSEARRELRTPGPIVARAPAEFRSDGPVGSSISGPGAARAPADLGSDARREPNPPGSIVARAPADLGSDARREPNPPGSIAARAPADLGSDARREPNSPGSIVARAPADLGSDAPIGSSISSPGVARAPADLGSGAPIGSSISRPGVARAPADLGSDAQVGSSLSGPGVARAPADLGSEAPIGSSISRPGVARAPADLGSDARRESNPPGSIVAGTPAGPGEPLESNRATSAGGDRGEAPPDERTEEQIDEPAEEQIAEPAEEQPDAPTEEQIDERPEEVPAAPLQFEAPPSIAPVFVNVRRGFEASGGDTLMAVGPTLEPLGESSHVARAVAGLAALGLPRFIGEGTGLVRIGGGRGLWVFAELDTIAFGIALTFALVYTARSVRSWRVLLASPLFVLLALVFLMLLSMGYSVVNFGTLFRLRLMLYAVLLMLPLGLRVGAEGSEGAADRAGDVDQV